MDIYNTLSTLITLVSVVIAIFQWYENRNIKTAKYKFRKINKYQFCFDFKQGQKVNIIYGKMNDIDKIKNYDEKTLVILGSNDKFNDNCITNNYGTLGTFINTIINSDKKEVIKETIRETAEKKYKEKLGQIGQWIMLNHNKYHRNKYKFAIGIVAVTNYDGKKAKASTSNIINAFKGVHEMAFRHYSNIYLPLLGSGEGGVEPNLALLCLLISIFEELFGPYYQYFSNINIIIYEDDQHNPKVGRKQLMQIAKYLSTIF